MIRARSARLRRVVAARTHVVSCARSLAATANFVATAMPSLHHAIIRMASELTRRDTSGLENHLESHCRDRVGTEAVVTERHDDVGEADERVTPQVHPTPDRQIEEVRPL